MNNTEHLLFQVIALAIADANRPFAGKGAITATHPYAVSALRFLFEPKSYFQYYCTLLQLPPYTVQKLLLTLPDFCNLQKRYQILKEQGYLRHLNS